LNLALGEVVSGIPLPDAASSRDRICVISGKRVSIPLVRSRPKFFAGTGIKLVLR
jgi:hypothetical protein